MISVISSFRPWKNFFTNMLFSDNRLCCNSAFLPVHLLTLRLTSGSLDLNCRQSMKMCGATQCSVSNTSIMAPNKSMNLGWLSTPSSFQPHVTNLTIGRVGTGGELEDGGVELVVLRTVLLCVGRAVVFTSFDDVARVSHRPFLFLVSGGLRWLSSSGGSASNAFGSSVGSA